MKEINNDSLRAALLAYLKQELAARKAARVSGNEAFLWREAVFSLIACLALFAIM